MLLVWILGNLRMVHHALSPTKMGEALRHRSLALGVALIITLGVSACGSTSHMRPTDSLVPRAPWLTIAVVRAALHPGNKVTHEHSEVSTDNASLVEQVRVAVNRLPLGYPGTRPACPADAGSLFISLIFRQQRQGGRVAAVKVNPFQCGPATWISISTRRRGPWAVHGTNMLVGLLEKGVGSQLKGFPRL
jgi:hypothetical protein